MHTSVRQADGVAGEATGSDVISSNWKTNQTTVQVFAGLMLLGDVVKIGYFASTGARVRGLPPLVPMMMTGTLVVSYLLVVLSA